LRLALGFRIERRGRLAEQQDRRIREEGASLPARRAAAGRVTRLWPPGKTSDPENLSAAPAPPSTDGSCAAACIRPRRPGSGR
jgi:hypothetical protein